MAQGLFSGTNTNPSVARPTEPSTATTTASTNSAQATINYTPAVVGPTATSYVITGTSSAGTITETSTSNSTYTTNTAAGGYTWSFSIAAQNANGSSGRSTDAGTAAITAYYAERLTTNASTTYTIPTGATKLAAIVISGSGSGGTPGQSYTGGTGGRTSTLVAFEEYSVTSGDVVTVTVGAAGGDSVVSIGATEIARATFAGNGTTNGTQRGALAGLAGGTGGSSTTGGSLSQNGNTGSNTSVTTTFTTSGALVNQTFTFGAGGGGGGSPYWSVPQNGYGTGLLFQGSDVGANLSGGNSGYHPGRSAGTGAGAGGNGGTMNTQTQNTFTQGNSPTAGAAATTLGSGGGGGGGTVTFTSTNSATQYGTASGTGGAGFTGRVILYTK